MTLQDLLVLKAKQQKPITVTLCGSTRFGEAYRKATLEETIANKKVLSVGCYWHSDRELIEEQGYQLDKTMLDILHFWKIDDSDEILVLNVNDYVGSSTANEISYAAQQGKCIRWLEPPSLEHLALAQQDGILVEVHRESVPRPCEEEMFRLLFDAAMLLNSQDDTSSYEEFEVWKARWLREAGAIFEKETAS